jgi:hypothetical protein
MSDKALSSPSIITLHFDVPEHYIPLSLFIVSAKSAKDIIDNFIKGFSVPDTEFEILVRAPEQGGLIELLEIAVKYGAPLWAIFMSDPGKAFVKELTGHKPTYWARKLGKKIRKLSEVDMNQVCKMLLALMVIGFLQKDTIDLSYLEEICPSKERFRAACTARDRLFEACIRNKEVQGLGFDASHDFLIKRSKFKSYIVKKLTAKERETTEEEKNWKVDTVDLKVHSPNWKKEHKRPWQGSTSKIKNVSFYIEDENFWEKVKNKDIAPDFIDKMRVQCAYIEGVAKPKNVRVLRVLSYNYTLISKPLSFSELLTKLSDFTVVERDQNDLLS